MRYFDNCCSGALYTDCFKAENLLILREQGGPWDSGKPYGTHMEIRVRMQILKHFMFEWFLFKNFMGIVKESREKYMQPYMVKLFESSFKENLDTNVSLKALHELKQIDQKKEASIN